MQKEQKNIPVHKRRWDMADTALMVSLLAIGLAVLALLFK